MQSLKDTPAVQNTNEEVYNYVNGQNNPISSAKLNYIKGMRLEMCSDDMIQPSGLLNLNYFKVSKGQYWSELETRILKHLVLRLGAYDEKENIVK